MLLFFVLFRTVVFFNQGSTVLTVKHILVPFVGKMLEAFAIPYRETLNSHTFTSILLYSYHTQFYFEAEMPIKTVFMTFYVIACSFAPLCGTSTVVIETKRR